MVEPRNFFFLVFKRVAHFLQSGVMNLFNAKTAYGDPLGAHQSHRFIVRVLPDWDVCASPDLWARRCGRSLSGNDVLSLSRPKGRIRMCVHVFLRDIHYEYVLYSYGTETTEFGAVSRQLAFFFLCGGIDLALFYGRAAKL